MLLFFYLSMTSLCTPFKLKNIVKEPTCFKNRENPSCIDSFLINCRGRFHNTCVGNQSLWFSKVVTIVRTSFEPLPPKIIKHRDYKCFDEEKFRRLFKKRLIELITDDITVDIFKITFYVLHTLRRRNIWELVSPILLTGNLKQSCKNQGFVMNILT